MLGTTDLNNPHDVEQLRRSVAMLPATETARIFTRSEALALLGALQRAHRESSKEGPPS